METTERQAFGVSNGNVGRELGLALFLLFLSPLSDSPRVATVCTVHGGSDSQASGPRGLGYLAASH